MDRIILEIDKEELDQIRKDQDEFRKDWAVMMQNVDPMDSDAIVRTFIAEAFKRFDNLP